MLYDKGQCSGIVRRPDWDHTRREVRKWMRAVRGPYGSVDVDITRIRVEVRIVGGLRGWVDVGKT